MPQNQPMPTPSEVTDDSLVFNEDVVEAVKAFARWKPWQGSLAARCEKFRNLHEALCPSGSPALMFDIPDVETNSGDSRFNQDMNAIELRGKLSVLTYLFLYFFSEAFEAVQNGTFDGVEPMVKAMTLFKRVFPKSYAKLRPGNGMFVSGGLHRDSTRLPVQAPNSAPAIGTESDSQVLPPAPQVVQPTETAKPERTDEEIGEI